MDIISSILLGVIEGVTEFLPISSTGHLVLASTLLNLPPTNFLKSFEIIIQLGAILAVGAIYWRRFLTDRSVLKRIIIAFIPTAMIGLIFYRIVKTYLLGNIAVVLGALFFGGLILILFELWLKQGELDSEKIEQNDVSNLPYWQAVVLGLCQSVAIIPGISRSAATIIGGLALGIRRETIVEFSFLLAVPTMVAATGLDLLKSSVNFSLDEWGMLAIGFCVSFLVAILAVKSFLKYIRHHDFIAFGIYRIIIAVVFALVLL